MTGLPGRLLVVCDLVTTDVCIATMAIMHTKMLADMDPYPSFASAELTEAACLSVLYGSLQYTEDP